MGVRALRNSRSNLALETLVGLASTGKSFLGRTKVATPEPEVLAALRVLAEKWSEDRRAENVLNAAGRSKFPEIRKAVTHAKRDS